MIQKVPTPITPITIDKDTRHITLAYFDRKSTVDYLGVVQGIPVCFDAKECAEDTFPLVNVHEHQVRYMTDFEKQQGLSFLLLSFTSRQEFYYMPYAELMEFWNRMEQGVKRRISADTGRNPEGSERQGLQRKAVIEEFGPTLKPQVDINA